MNEKRLNRIENHIRAIDLTISKLNKERNDMMIEFNKILSGL